MAHALASTDRARIGSSRARSTIIALHAQGQPGRADGQALHLARIGIAGKVTPADRMLGLGTKARCRQLGTSSRHGRSRHRWMQTQRHVLMRHVSQRCGRAPNPAPICLSK